MYSRQHGGRSGDERSATGALARSPGKQSLVEASAPARERSTTGALQRSPGKQSLVEAGAPARAPSAAVPAGQVIQRQEDPAATHGSGACLDPEAVQADLERIGGEIETIRSIIDPDGAGADGVALPAYYTNRLRELSDQLDVLRPAVEGCGDPVLGGQLRALYRTTQDALLAAFQTLAVYHADQTLQAWSNTSDANDADLNAQDEQRQQYHDEAADGRSSTRDWCGMFVDAQYRAAGLHGALNQVFNSTDDVEAFYNYQDSNRSPLWIQPYGTGELTGVEAYHTERGSLRSWAVGGEIGDDIRPGDVVTLDWYGSTVKLDHICIVRSYTPGSGGAPGELITIDGNAYGARKPGAANPDWDNLDKAQGDMAALEDAPLSDVSTSRYETGLGDGRSSTATDPGPSFNRDAMLDGDASDVYHAMTIHGRGRPSLVDFEPDHVYYKKNEIDTFTDRGRPQGPLQRPQASGGAGGGASHGAQIMRSETGAVAAADPAGAFDTATRGAASELPYRDEMQRHFRADFSNVRAYVGRDLTALGARAATRGDQVAFASGTPDREIVAHELTHVLQARDGRVGGAPVSAPGDASEHEARATASEIAAGRPAPVAAGAAAPSAEIHREEDPKHPPAVQPDVGTGRGNELDWDADSWEEGFVGLSMLRVGSFDTHTIREIYERALLGYLQPRFPDICALYAIPGPDESKQGAERHAAVTAITNAIRARMLRLIRERTPEATQEAEDMRIRLFIANQSALVDTLAVESNWRYQKDSTDDDTFCNVYAYDVVNAMGGYLPRVWWTEKGLEKIAAKEPVKNELPDADQQNADQLMIWMRDFGIPEFGWVELPSARAAQTAANTGQIVIILGQNGEFDDRKSGHVSVVLAESEQHQHIERPHGTGDGAYLPLQSQAGWDNFAYSDTDSAVDTYGRKPWWTLPEFTDTGFFAYRGVLGGEYAIQTPDRLGTELPRSESGPQLAG